MTKKIITICASASHYRDVLKIEKELLKLGFKTKIPHTAKIMHKNKDFNINNYKTWYQDKRDYFKKTKLMINHFKKIINADAILVVNMNKNGVGGYIGGNTLMEMAIAFHYKKPIFIYNEISEGLQIKEEVYGVNPKFIQKDLSKIKIS